MPASLGLAIIVVSTSVLAAVAALLFVQARGSGPGAGRARRAHAPVAEATGQVILVFDDRLLVDSNADGQRFSDAARAAQSACATRCNTAGDNSIADDLDCILLALAPHFPTLRCDLAQLAARGCITLTACDGSGFELIAHWRGGLAHLQITDTRAEGSCLLIDRLSYDALQSELHSLRDALGHAPVLIWREDSDGAVVWANSSYLDLAARGPGLVGWPLPRLFPAQAEKDTPRQQIDGPAPARWFDRSCVPQRDGSLHFALPADTVTHSEQARSDLVQTLAGAFATHAVGLAVFDEARALQIFNPALVDMTGLSVEFLAARPSFDQLLHALRECRMLPEPADYRSWRSALLAMERAALSGAYHEEWHLPSGQVLHVTGRPHPGGGIAFLFEDVTHEITLTRSFRAQIDTAQAVIDTLSDAMAVFSAQGTLTFANAAYHRLWGTDPADVAGRVNLHGALEIWCTACHPGPVWASLSQLAHSRSSAEPVSGSVVMRNGQILDLRTARLDGGNTLVTFAQAAAQPLPVHADTAAPVAAPQIAADNARQNAHAAHRELLARTDAQSLHSADAKATAQTPDSVRAPIVLSESSRSPRTGRVRHLSSRSTLRA